MDPAALAINATTGHSHKTAAKMRQAWLALVLIVLATVYVYTLTWHSNIRFQRMQDQIISAPTKFVADHLLSTRRPPSCRIEDFPDDPLVREYGATNIRLSRSYEGSGTRVQKLLAKLTRGEPIKIAVVGGSVSKGHAIYPPLTSDNYMYMRILEWFQTTFPSVSIQLSTDAVIAATVSILVPYQTQA